MILTGKHLNTTAPHALVHFPALLGATVARTSEVTGLARNQAYEILIEEVSHFRIRPPVLDEANRSSHGPDLGGGSIDPGYHTGSSVAYISVSGLQVSFS